MTERLVSVSELAAFLSVTADWVYVHADELGAWRLGDGPKARLRFDLDEVRSRLTACTTGRTSGVEASRTVEPKKPRRGRRVSAETVPLLPIRGRSAA